MTKEEVQAEVDWYLHHPDDEEAEREDSLYKIPPVVYMRFGRVETQNRPGAFLPTVGAILVAGVIVGAVVGVLVTLWQHFIPVTH